MKAVIDIERAASEGQKRVEVEVVLWLDDDSADDIFLAIGVEDYYVKRADLLRLLRAVPPKSTGA